MTLKNETTCLEVLKIVQVLLQGEQDKSLITPTLIDEKISIVLILNPPWNETIDRNWIIEELIRRFSVWIGKDASLINNDGHEPWLTTERKQGWRYWQRYSEWQESKLPYSAIRGLNDSTDHVLGLLENPLRDGAWDRRGLVVGHVQSGKTANYTGLICKAADAGYKIIIVLAGMHNNLRSQTQMRLDEGFLGYETSPFKDKLKIIGVGELDGDLSIRPNYATNRTNNGDFSASVARNLGITPEQRPWLFVVKKNKTVLQRLYKWIQDHVADTTDTESGRKVVTKLPLLVIDDEADHASVDTGEMVIAQDGKPDLDHQPTAINSLIRKILHTFSRKAYVGYTATPFANIFIHERGETKDEGPDLFPSAFIINLGAPSNYIGPARVFGLASIDSREGDLPLVRTIDDQCSKDGKSGWIPTKHQSTHRPEYPSEVGFPPSLLEAIDAFLLSCAVRKIRGQGDKHSSMLIHVTRFNAVQKVVHERVERHIQNMQQRMARQIGHEPVLARIESLWRNDFAPTSIKVESIVPSTITEETENWSDVCHALLDVIGEIDVRMINGSAKDALDYVDSPTGLKVIAIGGDKLARGLTLEGLCTSYFLRASRMYDTLMQMGRWFGYRHGYLDLCRLYTTEDLVEWFEHIADAAEELREEFDTMVACGGTPRDYGLKVKSHPVLMVTSRLKMRTARSLYLSFSGSVVETVSFFRDSARIKKNFNAFKALTSQIGISSKIPDKQRGKSPDKWTGAMWENVPWEQICDFLSQYETHPESMKVNSKLLSKFITNMAIDGELTSWVVTVIGGQVTEKMQNVGGIDVPLAKRTGKPDLLDRYAIRRLLSPRDEGIDLDEDAWLAALKETQKVFHGDPGRREGKIEPDVPNGPFLRKVRGFGAEGIKPHPERGVLIIYMLDPDSAGIDFPNNTDPIVGFGISFPGSNSGKKVEYKVNNVLWEQEYGAAD
ncbi:Z1 domain-containing protein [Shewanella sp. DW31]|uniref:Z1 domain-containing protein n=1 Tax=Shewanella sp. DW31 TaxID=2699422 RepID=UPI0018E37D40|nr:Z1 domain-containing protein [Shewanella sp. DW31]